MTPAEGYRAPTWWRSTPALAADSSRSIIFFRARWTGWRRPACYSSRRRAMTRSTWTTASLGAAEWRGRAGGPGDRRTVAGRDAVGGAEGGDCGAGQCVQVGTEHPE